MILGLHCDARAGALPALARARDLGCAALQIFPYRRHEDPGPEDAAPFRAALRESGLRLLCHARYVPFLGSSEPERRRRSATSLKRELRLSRWLGAEALVVHLGAWSEGATRRDGMKAFALGAKEALPDDEDPPPLWVENVPGGGRRMGGSLEELSEVLELLDASGVRAAACVDTAHAWAAGYDLSSNEGGERFLESLRRLLAGRVAAFHLNDSRAPRGSRRESHAHWGEGRLGARGLAALLKSPEHAAAYGILETPPGRDAENLEFVRKTALSAEPF